MHVVGDIAVKKRRFFFYHIFVFIFAQLAWLSVLGLWIYWYVSNYIFLNKVGEKFSFQITSKANHVSILVGGLVLLVAISVGMFLIFRRLTIQLKLTALYDNFIANVTHELKSPLASIQLYLETMDAREVPWFKQKEFIALMLKDASRLDKLINSILVIPGLEQKKIAYDYHVYSTESLVRSIVGEAVEQFKLPKKAVKIEGSAPCQCVVDKNALKIVFDNLIDNSIKYTTKPVQITVSLKCTSKAILIEFCDQGIGISSKEQKKIFNKFHRIYHSGVPSVKGTGLGLYWVKEIIKYHSGKVEVFSKGNGTGTTFRIKLPIYQVSKKRRLNNLLKISQKLKKQQDLNNG